MSVLFLSCNEDETSAQYDKDTQIINAYVKAENLDGEFQSNGIFKIVQKEGEGEQNPTVGSGVLITYTLMLANKTVINGERNILLQNGLNLFFEGFDFAVSTMVKGEKARFFIPSAYAYGSNSFTVDGKVVPSNAVVFVEIELLEIIKEELIIDYYLSQSSLNAEKSNSGLFYKINNLGVSEIKPDINDIVTLNYTVSFTTDTVLSTTNSYSFVINEMEDWVTTEVVDGLEEGVLLMKEGDEATFIIPPNLAYGADGTSSVPGNSILIYKVKLTKVTK